VTNPRVDDVARYDTSCAYCGDGVPVRRFRAKAACADCLEAFAEGGLERAPSDRRVVREALGKGPRDYPEPLWKRAAT
jgi:hypothetical protein